MTLNFPVVLVGSGKGGVGKSTLSVNLSVALAQEGVKVGLLDADISGPSIPLMLGLRRVAPLIKNDKIVPFFKYGIHSMSMGNILQEAQAALWRGPVLHTILQKLLFDVEWGALDLLIVDLPPGTGDIPLTLSQEIAVKGAIVITTPQELAFSDAMKAINAFDQLNIPLLGIVENMTGFRAPDSHIDFPIFGPPRGQLIAERFGSTLLGSLPYLPPLQWGADTGIPSAFATGSDSTLHLFSPIGKKLMKLLRQ